MALGPIPWTAMIEYIRWLGIEDRDDQAEWLRILKEMDGAYQEVVNRKKE